MTRRQLITLPDNINPGGLLTIKAASKLSGIPESTIRGYRRQPDCGLKFYRVGSRLFLNCGEFIAWINLVAVEASVRKLSFSSDSVARSKAAPASRHHLSYSDPASPPSPAGRGRGYLKTEYEQG